MQKKWTEEPSGKVVFILGGLIFTFSSWGSWWAVLPGIVTVGWLILLFQDVKESIKTKRLRSKGD